MLIDCLHLFASAVFVSSIRKLSYVFMLWLVKPHLFVGGSMIDPRSVLCDVTQRHCCHHLSMRVDDLRGSEVDAGRVSDGVHCAANDVSSVARGATALSLRVHSFCTASCRHRGRQLPSLGQSVWRKRLLAFVFLLQAFVGMGVCAGLVGCLLT